MFQQIYDPVAHSLAMTSLVAALPLLTMFVLLGGLKWSPLTSGVCSLLVAMAVAVFAYGMPVGVTVNAAFYGAAFSVLSIILIVINAIWIQNMMVESGYFKVLRRTFGMLSGDLRVQAVLIAFCFGALLEALAGAGTPIAIVAVMLVALGMDPLKAAVCALAADTAPVAFGALAVPITTLAAVTGQPYDQLGAIVGRQTPVLSVVIPLVLVWIVDGRRGIRQIWPAAVVTGLAFGIAQFVCSNFISGPAFPMSSPPWPVPPHSWCSWKSGSPARPSGHAPPAARRRVHCRSAPRWSRMRLSPRTTAGATG